MTIKPGFRDLFWIAVGALLLVAVTLLVLQNYRRGEAAAKAASRAERTELVTQMSAALAAATEAEKSAVMAVTDQESQAYADQARAAAAEVAGRGTELAALLAQGGSREERDLLAQFTQAFAECQRIDRELLDLAVRNTNLKAYDLAFGPAAQALASMDSALARILRERAASTSPAAQRTLLLAARAQCGALRIQALLAPHIAEESGEKMGAFEAAMAKEDQAVRADLEDLAPLLGRGSADLATAEMGYARFSELRTQILALSRQNTNVRSLILSLNGKRRAVLLAQEALGTLEQAIAAEPATVRPPVSPR